MKKLLFLILLPITLFGQDYPTKPNKDDQLVERNGYVLSYNETCEQPNWVMYTLTSEDLIKGDATRKNYFKSDRSFETLSASSSDYTRSGYDRGHLKPAADESNNQAQMDETFYMSNISPQLPGFNRGIWKKLENYVRVELIGNDSIM